MKEGGVSFKKEALSRWPGPVFRPVVLEDKILLFVAGG
jgi:hypothetical protein